MNCTELNEDVFQELNDKIAQILEKEEYKKSACQDFKNAIKDFNKSIQAAKASDKRNKYMISFIGAVKAGKSTLLNALCRKKVCESGAATETTKNCTIILNTTADERIVLYTHKKELKNLTDNSIEILLNHVLSPEGQFKNDDFDEKVIQLNDDGLNLINSGENIVLAVIYIKVKDGSILSNKTENEGSYSIALIDLPGLDGLAAGIDHHPVVKYICHKSNHCILVQGSVGALNNTTIKTINNIKKEFGDINIYNVFNYFNATPWHNEKAIEKSQIATFEKHKNDLIEQKLGGYPKYKINAQMAWEAYSPENELLKYKQDWREGYDQVKILEQSGIEELEESLSNISEENMSKSIKEASIKKICDLKNIFDKDSESMGEIKNKLISQKDDLEILINDIITAKNHIYDKLQNIHINDLSSSTKAKFEEQRKAAEDNFKTTLNKKITDETSYSGTEKNKKLDSLIAAIKDSMYTVKIEPVFSIIHKKIKGTIDAIYKELDEKYKNEQWYKNIKKYDYIEHDLNKYVEIKTGIDESKLAAEKSTWLKAKTQVWLSKYKGKELKAKILEITGDEFSKMVLGKDATWETTLENITNEEMKKFKDFLDSEYKNKIIKSNTNEIELIDKMLSDIEKLKLSTDDLIDKIAH